MYREVAQLLILYGRPRCTELLTTRSGRFFYRARFEGLCRPPVAAHPQSHEFRVAIEVLAAAIQARLLSIPVSGNMGATLRNHSILLSEVC